MPAGIEAIIASMRSAANAWARVPAGLSVGTAPASVASFAVVG
jgi:hypothetical protein